MGRRLDVLRRLEQRMGFRGFVLFCFGLFDLLYGFSIGFPDRVSLRSPQFCYYDSMLGHETWAAVWWCVGLVLIYYAFQQDDKVGYAVGLVIKLWWMFFHIIAQFAQPNYERAWVNALVFGVWAAFIYREASRPEPPHRLDDSPAGGENRS